MGSRALRSQVFWAMNPFDIIVATPSVISNGLRSCVVFVCYIFGAAIRAARGVVVLIASVVLGLSAAAIQMVAWIIVGLVSGFSPLMRLASWCAKIALVFSPILIVVFLIVCAVANPFVRNELGYAHDRSTATEVIDANGRWVGVIPPNSFADWSGGSVLAPDHAAVPLVSIPPTWRKCITFLEDRTAFEGISNWLGINPIALVGSGIQTISGHRRRGASTLNMQVVRTLNGQSPRSDEPLGAIAVRKVAELVGATSLASMLRDRDPQLAERYIGMHLPLIIGSSGSRFGDPLYGVEIAARILFAKPAIALLPEEQAIIAAAVKSPVVLAPPGDDKGHKLALGRWARIKLRAEYCLANAFTPDSPQIAAARRRLIDLQLPTPSVEPAMMALLPSDKRVAWQIVVSPVRRALYFSNHDIRLARRELDQAFGQHWRGGLAAIRLTTSAVDSRRFKSDVTKALRELQATIPGLTVSLSGAEAGPAAHVVIAVADAEGRLRLLYSSHDGLFLTRKTEIGSTAKMLAAIVLGRRTSPNTPYCRAPIPGMTVATANDGAACHDRSLWLPAREAFARSNSQAVHWALRHYVAHNEMQTTAAVFGLPGFGDVPAATALTFGIVELTPAKMLQTTEAIGHMIAGDWRDVPVPAIVSEATFIRPNGQAEVMPISLGAPLHGDAIHSAASSRIRSFVANVLAATSGPSGTLHSLAGTKAALGGALYAKTGTVSVSGDTQALQIAGVFMRAGRPWSFTVMIASPDSRHPVGRKLAAGQFAPLVGLSLGRLILGGSGTSYAMTR